MTTEKREADPTGGHRPDRPASSPENLDSQKDSNHRRRESTLDLGSRVSMSRGVAPILFGKEIDVPATQRISGW